MARHPKYVPKSFESDGNHSDTSANIYMSMLMSESWRKLTKNQRLLYLYCKAQYYAEKRKPKPKVKQLTPDELALCFTMNKNKYINLYGLYTENNHKMFKKDIQALIDNGFILEIENGKYTRTSNIYMFSSNWHH